MRMTPYHSLFPIHYPLSTIPTHQAKVIEQAAGKIDLGDAETIELVEAAGSGDRLLEDLTAEAQRRFDARECAGRALVKSRAEGVDLG